VSRFEGGIIGSKAHGVQDLVCCRKIYLLHVKIIILQVGEIVLTSNDLRVRADKMKMGRIAIIVKEHAGYEEGNNMFMALKALAELTEALKSDRKVLNNQKHDSIIIEYH
jgi:hypothetical protein